MPNGARHILGAAIGLILTPVTAAGLMFGTERLYRGLTAFQLDDSHYRMGGLVLAGTALLLGVLVGSRISPLASLIPGVAFSTIGVLWLLAPRWTADKTIGRSADLLPGVLARGYRDIGPSGPLLILGVLLLVASLFPARWAARQRAVVGGGSPYENDAPTQPYGQGPQPGQQADAGQRPGPYLPGSSAPVFPPPAASGHHLPSSGSDLEGGAGGWTQMYGTGGAGRGE